MIYTSEASGFCDAIFFCASGSATLALSSREPFLFPHPLSLSVHTCLQRGHWSQYHKTWKAVIFPAGLRCIFPRTCSARQRARLSGRAFPPSVRPRSCSAKGAARGNTALFCEIYFCAEQHHSARVQKERCISGGPTVPLLANLFDHVWLAACMSAG